MFDVYSTHTKSCQICQTALTNLRRGQLAALVVAVAAAVQGESTGSTDTCRTRAVRCILVRLFCACQFLIAQSLPRALISYPCMVPHPQLPITPQNLCLPAPITHNLPSLLLAGVVVWASSAAATTAAMAAATAGAAAGSAGAATVGVLGAAASSTVWCAGLPPPASLAWLCLAALAGGVALALGKLINMFYVYDYSHADNH